MTADRLTEIKARVADFKTKRAYLDTLAMFDPLLSDLEYALGVIANYEEVLEDKRRIAREMDKTEIGELQRENARLRTALESIAEYDCPSGVHPRQCDGCAACDARATLIGAPVGSGRL